MFRAFPQAGQMVEERHLARPNTRLEFNFGKENENANSQTWQLRFAHHSRGLWRLGCRRLWLAVRMGIAERQRLHHRYSSFPRNRREMGLDGRRLPHGTLRANPMPSPHDPLSFKT